MAISIGSRIRKAWNAFTNRDPTEEFKPRGYGSSYRQDRLRLSGGNEKSIVTSVMTRIAMDVAAINIRHVRLDENGRFLDEMDTSLNDCFSLEANIDQTGRMFVQDAIMSMLDEGCIAILPVDTTTNPNKTGSYDIKTMRVCKILEWFPRHVRVRAYNDRTGEKVDITVPKHTVAIIENPLYAIMNEPNSTMKRLVNKLNLLDVVDETSSSGKLDMIIQLPYVIKTEAMKKKAQDRRNDIEEQLSGSKYGIAYTDGTEKVTQLNRAVGNNLMAQVEYLTKMMYSQLSMTQDILDGSADEQTMLNYYSRTVEPMVAAIVNEGHRKFLTPTARTQRQALQFFRDPFTLVPVSEIAEIADKFTRNEIMTSNELRATLGMRPSTDPKADELRNKNLSQPREGSQIEPVYKKREKKPKKGAQKNVKT